MVGDCIKIKDLTLEELSGIVTTYPWFSGARKELCIRMSRMGEAWDTDQFSKAALYINSRKSIHNLLRTSREKDYSDKEMEQLLRKYQQPAPAVKVRVIGGDYFTQAEYDNVRRDDDKIFSGFASGEKDTPLKEIEEENTEFCTETLARVFLEQGYYDKARNIYSKLILRYPEKNTYFATLIEKIDKNI